MKKFFNEFKEFAIKGNVVDMAVGGIVGGAFGKIVSSLVNDVIMPIITMLTGAADFTDLSIVLRAPIVDATGKTLSEGILLKYGSFLQNVIDFLIIALVIFMMLKVINKLTQLRKKEEIEEPVEEKGPTTEELLSEIRDLLKEK